MYVPGPGASEYDPETYEFTFPKRWEAPKPLAVLLGEAARSKALFELYTASAPSPTPSNLRRSWEPPFSGPSVPQRDTGFAGPLNE